MPQGAQHPRANAYISVHAQGKVHIYQHLRASAYISGKALLPVLYLIHFRHSQPKSVLYKMVEQLPSGSGRFLIVGNNYNVSIAC